MYYIADPENRTVLAADENFLSVLGVKNISELYIKMANEEIACLYLSDEKVIIETPYSQNSYPIKKTALSSLLGTVYLVELEISGEETVKAGNIQEETPILKEDFLQIKEPNVSDNSAESDIFNADNPEHDDLISIKEPIEQDLPAPEANEENELLLLPAEEFSPAESLQTTSLNAEQQNNDLYDLILPGETDHHISEIQTQIPPQAENQTNNIPDISLDAVKLSEKIGVSVEDYNLFLNEYIDTALMLEEDLQSSEADKQKNAIQTLMHLSNVLGISAASDILGQIDTAAQNDKKMLIKSFYTALSKITTHVPSKEDHDLLLTADVTPYDDTQPETPLQSAQSFGNISFEEVKPIHFDFQLKQAANDLNLPQELVQEFMLDFIKQAHTETQKMLAAYQRGDLAAVQKIGHFLKGVASNLRIDPLADTLYDIQFCEDSSRLEDLIKRYWGHFLSFENQMNLTSK
ncbi:MAG: Hpt domain-containing protein [Sulfurovum sp.]|nr:Hpt domain-containing protein [Sulfurovum sp.]MDD3603008.1 Hpt domain-containing protein [Sulfurovum sp.]